MGCRQSDPVVAHAASIGWQVIERSQAVEPVNQQTSNRLGRGEAQIDRHAPPLVSVEVQAAPAEHAGAGRAEPELKRRARGVGTDVGRDRPGMVRACAWS